MILLLKRPGDRHALHVDGHGENLKILPRKRPIELLHRRHLYPAGAAPGGPKIQHYHFATQVRKRHEMAIQIWELEVRRRLTQLDDVAFSDRRDIRRRRTAYPNQRDHQTDGCSSNREPHHPFLAPRSDC